ncbi:hypothetical protein K1719_022833 [Acacia pycnantha]|nr:hypothetical protein K1719_022833 [Acacia pycnantha]
MSCLTYSSPLQIAGLVFVLVNLSILICAQFVLSALVICPLISSCRHVSLSLLPSLVRQLPPLVQVGIILSKKRLRSMFGHTLLLLLAVSCMSTCSMETLLKLICMDKSKASWDLSCTRIFIEQCIEKILKKE